ncbi:MAG: class I SAM-dependent methyltransferase, partial [bacterium]
MGYDQNYESVLMRGVQDPRPWNLIEIIKSYCKKTDKLLDLGCGTAFKTIQLASCVKIIYGIDNNKKMLKKAKQNIQAAKIKNIFLTNADVKQIPFDDNFFNIATCMVAPHDTKELFRVLKPGGYAILEKLGDRDHWNFKKEFDRGKKRKRGQFADFRQGERAGIYKKEFEKLFSEVIIRNEFWKTWYSDEGLYLLLEQTPMIKNSNKEKDKKIVET